MSGLLQDIRYGVRLLIKSPGFTLLALLSLAVGIGLNTAIFTFVNAILFEKLPVDKPEQLVQLYTTDSFNPGNLNSSYPNYQDIRDRNEVFSGVATFAVIPTALTIENQTERFWGAIVSGNYFSVIGIKPAIGRAFLDTEDKVPGADPVVVIGHGLWIRNFGADPEIVGKKVVLNGHDFTVIGVAPKGFRGTDHGLAAELWVPMMMHDEVLPGFNWIDKRQNLWLSIIARVKEGVPVSQAEASVATLGSRLEQAYPEANKDRGISLVPLVQARLNSILRLMSGTRGNVYLVSGILLAVSWAIMLIACANVGILLLSRESARQKEMALRIALGAKRTRLIRQTLTESFMLSGLGGLLGVFMARWTSDALSFLRPPVPTSFEVDANLTPTVIMYGAVLSLITGLLLGIVPALQASRPALVQDLKGNSATAKRGGRKFGFSDMFVVFQVMLSSMLLIGAGLFVQSLQNASDIDVGFASDKLLTMAFDVRLVGYNDVTGKEFYQRVIDRISALPGVEDVSMVEILPLEVGAVRRNVTIEGQAATPDQDKKLIDSNIAGPRYFRTMGIPLLEGRDFTEMDNEKTTPKAIINETMAKRYWPGTDPLGRRFSTSGPGGPYIEVIGIARDTVVHSIGEPPLPCFYLPRFQVYYPQMKLVVRTTGDPAAMLPVLPGEIRALDSKVPIFDVKTISEHAGNSLWAARVGAQLFAAYGLLALALAVLGSYGAVSYGVARRFREIAIRMALGAQAGKVLKNVIFRNLLIAAIGILLGFACAYPTMKLVAKLLYGVSSTDPRVYFKAIAIIIGVAVVAGYLPARRATRIDPLVILKSE